MIEVTQVPKFEIHKVPIDQVPKRNNHKEFMSALDSLEVGEGFYVPKETGEVCRVLRYRWQSRTGRKVSVSTVGDGRKLFHRTA